MVRSFYEQFMLAQDLSLHKWHHYFPIYEAHFSRFVGQPVKFLEIGVQMGGSAQLFRRILGDQAHIIGIDIDERSRDAAIAGEIDVEIGDQSDVAFLIRVAKTHGPFDIILDDGGHRLNQIWTSFETLFAHVNDGGVYLIEDVSPQFWPSNAFRDPKGERTIGDFIAKLYASLNSNSGKGALFAYWHLPEDERKRDLADQSLNAHVKSVHLYDSIIAVEKGKRDAPLSELRNPKDNYLEFRKLMDCARNFNYEKSIQDVEKMIFPTRE